MSGRGACGSGGEAGRVGAKSVGLTGRTPPGTIIVRTASGESAPGPAAVGVGGPFGRSDGMGGPRVRRLHSNRARGAPIPPWCRPSRGGPAVWHDAPRRVSHDAERRATLLAAYPPDFLKRS